MLATSTSLGTVIAGEPLGPVLISGVQGAGDHRWFRACSSGSTGFFLPPWPWSVILFALVALAPGSSWACCSAYQQQAIGVYLLLAWALARSAAALCRWRSFRWSCCGSPRSPGRPGQRCLRSAGRRWRALDPSGILPQLGILAAYAAFSLNLVARRLRHVPVRGSRAEGVLIVAACVTSSENGVIRLIRPGCSGIPAPAR